MIEHFLFSIYTSEDFDAFGYGNHVTLITEKHTGLLQENVGTTLNISQHASTDFTDLEAATYEI